MPDITFHMSRARSVWGFNLAAKDQSKIMIVKVTESSTILKAIVKNGGFYV